MTRIGILNAAGAIRLVTSDISGEDIAYGTVENVPDLYPDSMDYVGGEFIDALDRIYARLAARIDAAAEAIIISFVTPGQGIQEARAEKRREVERITADSAPDPDPADYPFLSAEAAARGVPIATIVGEVEAAIALWLGAGAQVEAVRVAGKAAIRAQTSRAGREAAAVATIAQLEAIRRVVSQ